jgi:hypothetical protein
MDDQLESRQAALILGILLEDPRADTDDLDWDVARRMAQRDRVLLRLADRMQRRDGPLPPVFTAATHTARAAAAAMLDIVARLTAACESCGAEYVVLKLAHQLPDTGSDVDLLVAGSAPDVDRAIQDHVPALAGRRRPVRKLTGKLRYVTARDGVVVDVHHGRLGPLGEERGLAALLLRQRRQVPATKDLTLWAPGPEDQLLLQAVQVCGRRALRLSDVYWTIATARDGRLEWRRLLTTAHALGLEARLSCYLDFVSQVHRDLFQRPLLPADVRSRLDLGAWGKIAFRGGTFRVPAARAIGRVCLEELRDRVGFGDWTGAGRLCLLPVAAAANRLRSLGRPRPAGA